MVRNKEWRDLFDQDRVQNVEVPGVRSKGNGSRKNEVRVRHLNARAVLAHHAHIQEMGKPFYRRCKMCRQGLPGAYYEVEAKVSSDSVVEGARVDEKGDDTLSLRNERSDRNGQGD